MKVTLRDTAASYFSKTDGQTYTGKTVFELPEDEALLAIANGQVEKVDEVQPETKKAEKVAKPEKAPKADKVEPITES